jgi:hypothetical protein
MGDDVCAAGSPLHALLSELRDIHEECGSPTYGAIKSVSRRLGDFYGGRYARFSQYFPSRTAFSNYRNHQRKRTISWDAAAATALSCWLYAWEAAISDVDPRRKTEALLKPLRRRHKDLQAALRVQPTAHQARRPTATEAVSDQGSDQGPDPESDQRSERRSGRRSDQRSGRRAAQPVTHTDRAEGAAVAATVEGSCAPVTSEGIPEGVSEPSPGADGIRRQVLGGEPLGHTADNLVLGVELADFLGFYDREWPRVARFMMWCGNDPAAAERTAKNALREVWRLRQDSGAERQKIFDPHVWLRSKALSMHPGQTGAPPDRWPEEITIHLGQETRRLLSALTTLRPDRRRVMAYSLDGFTPDVIADQLGLPAEQAVALVEQARFQLAGRLGNLSQYLDDTINTAAGELLKYIEDNAGFEEGLADIAGATSSPPDRARMATEALRLRIAARALDRKLQDAVHNLDRAIDLGREVVEAGDQRATDTGRDRDLVNARLRCCELEVGEASTIARNIARDFPFAPAHDLERALAAVPSLDEYALEHHRKGVQASLKDVIRRATALRDKIIDDAQAGTTRLIHRLRAMRVDATGVDLSGLTLPVGVKVASGVVWNSGTIWPDAVCHEVMEHSKQVGRGVLRVHSDTRPAERPLFLEPPVLPRPGTQPAPRPAAAVAAGRGTTTQAQADASAAARAPDAPASPASSVSPERAPALASLTPPQPLETPEQLAETYVDTYMVDGPPLDPPDGGTGLSHDR